MNPGHLISTLGAGAALVGASLLDWVRLPEVPTAAPAYAAGPTGQVVLGLAALALLGGAAGLAWPRLSGRIGRATLLLGGLMAAWLVGAWAAPHTALGAAAHGLPSGMTVAMGAGFALAAAGGLLTVVGSLWAVRRADADLPRPLRATLLRGGTPVGEHVLDRPGAWSPPGLPETAPQLHVGPLGDVVLAVAPSATRGLTLNGEQRPLDGACGCHDRHHVALEPGDWGLVDQGDDALFFHFAPQLPPRGALAALRDEFVAATVMAALVLQVGLLSNAALAGSPRPDQPAADALGLEQMGQPWRPGPRADLAYRVEGAPAERTLRALGTWLAQRWTAAPARDEAPPPAGAAKPAARTAVRPSPAGAVTGHGLARLLADPGTLRRSGLAGILTDRGAEQRIAQAMEGATGAAASGPGVDFVGNAQADRRLASGTLLAQRGGAAGPPLTARARRRVRPVALPGRAVTAGTCDAKRVQDALARRAAALQACYERRLQTRPDLSGQAILRWVQGADGQARAVALRSSTLGDRPLERCLERTVARLRLPPRSDGGACVIQWPFAFLRPSAEGP